MVQGLSSKVAIDKQTEFGTAKSISTNCLFPILSASIFEKQGMKYVHRKGASYQGFDRAIKEKVEVAGNIEINHRYAGCNILYDMMFGIPLKSTVESGVYQFTYILGATPLYATFAEDTTISVRNFHSMWFEEMTISSSPGDALKVALSAKAQKMELDTPNSSSSGWTERDVSEVVMLEDATFFLAPFSSLDAFDSGDEIEVSGFELKITREVTGRQTKKSGFYNDNPSIKNVSVSGNFELPLYSSDTWLTAYKNSTMCMAKIVFTGRQISGKSTNYSLTYWLPSIILSYDSTLNSNAMEQKLEFRAVRMNTLAAGFPYRSTEVIAQTVNTNDGTYI